MKDMTIVTYRYRRKAPPNLHGTVSECFCAPGREGTPRRNVGYTARRARDLHAVVILFTFSLGVVVEALSTLLPQPLRVNHALEEDARTVLGVARVCVQGLLDSKTSVQPDTAQAQ